MVYVYKCKKCDEEFMITKPMSKAARVENCNKCKIQMVRVYNIAGIKTGDGVKS